MTHAAASSTETEIEPYCISCGRTEFTPCETSSGPCGWHIVPHMSGRGMCTGCAHRYDNPARVFRQVEQLLNSWRRARVLKRRTVKGRK